MELTGELLEALAVPGGPVADTAILARLRESLQQARRQLVPNCSKCARNAVALSEKQAFDAAKRALAAAPEEFKRQLRRQLQADRLTVRFQQGHAVYEITL